MKDVYWPWEGEKLHLVCYECDETDTDPDACDGTTLSTRVGADRLLELGIICHSSVLAYEFEAGSWVEGMIEHHKRQGFEPYVSEKISASRLVKKMGEKLVGWWLVTEPLGDYPGGFARVVRLNDDPNAEDIAFIVEPKEGSEIGVFDYEQVSLTSEDTRSDVPGSSEGETGMNNQIPGYSLQESDAENWVASERSHRCDCCWHVTSQEPRCGLFNEPVSWGAACPEFTRVAPACSGRAYRGCQSGCEDSSDRLEKT